MLIGCLAIKPQLGLAFPVILLATLRWRALAAAVVTVALTLGLSVLWPGLASWRGFAALFNISRQQLLETSGVGFNKIQSLFAALRLYGVSIYGAYAAQAALAVAVGGSLALVWRSTADYRLKAAAAAVATLLMTPFCLAYDLLIEVPAAAFFLAYGAERSFRPGELVAIAVALLSPEIGATGVVGNLPVGFAGMALLYAVIAFRTWTDLRPQSTRFCPDARPQS